MLTIRAKRQVFHLWLVWYVLTGEKAECTRLLRSYPQILWISVCADLEEVTMVLILCVQRKSIHLCFLVKVMKIGVFS
jgi:hypothetical protein